MDTNTSRDPATIERGRGRDNVTEEDASKTKNTCLSRLRTVFKCFYKTFYSVLSLFILLILYAVMGAAIFRALEAPHERREKSDIIAERNVMVEIMWNFSREFPNQTEDSRMDWTFLAHRMLLKYEERIYIAYKNGISTQSTDEVWSFWGALFFCGTVFTTIGYGHIAPSTSWGRIVCIVYATIGIPLALIVLANLGKKLTRILKYLWAFIRRFYYTGYCRKVRKAISDKTNVDPVHTTKEGLETVEPSVNIARGNTGGVNIKPLDVSGAPLAGEDMAVDDSVSSNGDDVEMVFGYEVDEEFNLPIPLALVIMLLYILGGAAMYAMWEDWTYLEACYFVFISISTIGFGDILPAHPNYFVLSFMYIFVGLSLVSMVINVTMEFFSETIDKAKVHIDKAKEITLEVAKDTIDKVQDTIEKVQETVEDITDDIKQKIGGDSGSRRSSVSGDSFHTGKSEAGSNVNLKRIVVNNGLVPVR